MALYREAREGQKTVHICVCDRCGLRGPKSIRHRGHARRMAVNAGWYYNPTPSPDEMSFHKPGRHHDFLLCPKCAAYRGKIPVDREREIFLATKRAIGRHFDAG